MMDALSTEGHKLQGLDFRLRNSQQSQHPEPGTGFEAKISKLTQSRQDLKYRNIFVRLNGIPVHDLCVLDILHGEFEIDPDIVWYIFRLSDSWKQLRCSWSRYSDRRSMVRFGILDGRTIRPAFCNFLNIGTGHVLIPRKSLPKSNNAQVAIFFSHHHAKKPLFWHDVTNPLSIVFQSDYSWQQVEKALLDRYVHTQASRATFKHLVDVQVALVASITERSAQEDNGTLEAIYLEALLYFQTEVCRVALADHHATSRNLLNRWKRVLPAYSPTELDDMSRPDNWKGLAHLVGNLHEQLNAAVRFRNVTVPLESSKCYIDRAFEEFDGIIREAQAVLNHVRERLAVEVSEASLEQSRAGIRMAKTSIGENRRTKALTVLAFVWIPFDLATSAFGMNVKEVNNTGRSISAFIITALALFLFAILCLVLMKLRHRAQKNWRQRGLDRAQDQKLLEPAESTIHESLKTPPVFSSKEAAIKGLCNPLTYIVLFRHGALLGFITWGRFDTQGFVIACDVLQKKKEGVQYESRKWKPYLLELLYLTGFLCLPDDRGAPEPVLRKMKATGLQRARSAPQAEGQLTPTESR